MNTITTNTLIHCAILLCSTTVPADEKLDAYTTDYLQSKGFTVNPQLVTDNVEKYNTGAKLYGVYRDNINRIQKISLIQEIYRSLWIYNFVATAFETLSPAQLLSAVNQKYEAEQVHNEDLDRNKFSAFKLIDREFCTSEMLKTSGKVLSKLSYDYAKALERVSKTFSEIEGMEYMSDIYSSAASTVTPASKPASVQPVRTAPVADSSATTVIASAPDVPPATQPQSSKIELQLRDEIRMLKSDKHDLEVKLSYAKKDAIREFVSTLTGYGWNCPLSELYRLLKDDETPEKIKGIINNLFMALGSENIKICRDKVGDIITLTEENQKTYDPYKNEQLFLGDKAEIFYPGYRYDHEIMVRPIVRKIKESDSNENG